jgi:hypothetical protein
LFTWYSPEAASLKPKHTEEMGEQQTEGEEEGRKNSKKREERRGHPSPTPCSSSMTSH